MKEIGYWGFDRSSPEEGKKGKGRELQRDVVYLG
jgi:hypothetical protein